MTDIKLKVGLRVKRRNMQGCCGTVKELRTEVTTTNVEAAEKSLMAYVLWDNGTRSCFAPEALEVVKD